MVGYSSVGGVGGTHSHALFTGPLGCDGNVTAPLLLSLTALLIEERQLGLNETGTSWNRRWHSMGKATLSCL